MRQELARRKGEAQGITLDEGLAEEKDAVMSEGEKRGERGGDGRGLPTSGGAPTRRNSRWGSVCEERRSHRAPRGTAGTPARATSCRTSLHLENESPTVAAG